MPRIDSHRPKIESQNTKSNLDGPKLTSQKATRVSPKTYSLMPQIEYTSGIAAESVLEGHEI